MERGSVKKATSFISAPQFGQVNGSAEYTLWISRAQVEEAEPALFDDSDNESSLSGMAGAFRPTGAGFGGD